MCVNCYVWHQTTKQFDKRQRKKWAHFFRPTFSFIKKSDYFGVFYANKLKKCMIWSAVQLIKILIVCKVMRKSLIISLVTIKVGAMNWSVCVLLQRSCRKRTEADGRIEVPIGGNRINFAGNRTRQWEECVPSREWYLISPGILSTLRFNCPINEGKE